MKKESLVIYTQDNKSEDELMRLKDEAQAWVEKSELETSDRLVKICQIFNVSADYFYFDQ